jgi:hypothetical protein
MALIPCVNRTLRQVVTVVATLSMIVSHSDQATVAAQSESTEKSYLIAQTGTDNPMKILGFTVNGTILDLIPDFRTEDHVVFPGASIRASDETWLKTSSVQIQNVTGKTVDGIWITLEFPEIGVADYIQIGSAKRRLWPPTDGIPSDEKSVFALNQGQKLDISLGANYEGTKSLRDRQSPNETTVCEIRIEMVFFSDGTAWSQGAFLHPDPDRPGHFIRMCAGSSATAPHEIDQHRCKTGSTEVRR